MFMSVRCDDLKTVWCYYRTKVPKHIGLLSHMLSSDGLVPKRYNSRPKDDVTRLTNKAISPWQMDLLTDIKNCLCQKCRKLKLKKLNTNVLACVKGDTVRCMFCIIKSNYDVSCISFQINREEPGHFLRWTDYIGFTSA